MEKEGISHGFSLSWWHSSVVLNHTVVQIIGIRDLRSLLLLRSQSWKYYSLNPWISPSILHICLFNMASYFSRTYSTISHIFLHSLHRKKKYHKTRSSLTAFPLNPRLPGILPFLFPFCISIVLEELTFFLTKNYAITFVMDLISYHLWSVWKYYILFLIFYQILAIILKSVFTHLFNIVYRIHV